MHQARRDLKIISPTRYARKSQVLCGSETVLFWFGESCDGENRSRLGSALFDKTFYIQVNGVWAEDLNDCKPTSRVGKPAVRSNSEASKVDLISHTLEGGYGGSLKSDDRK